MSQYTFGPSEKPVVMTGATSSAAGAAGYAPAPAAGDDAKYLKGDGTWDSPSSLPSVSGSDNGKVLQVSNGAWSAENALSGFYTKPSGGIPNSDLATPPAVMTGATSSAAGASGYVPAPAAGDDDKFLAGDGTFKSGGKPMVILSYGNSTWNDFINAYNNNVIVYCRASSGSDPSSGSQTRMAFMAYVNNSETPTEVEFQYYRSMSSHSATAMGDEVYVYKLTNSNGGTWTVTTRKASIKEIAVASGSKLSVSWSSDKVTLSNTMTASDLLMTGATSSAAGTAGTVPAPAAGEQTHVLMGDGTWSDDIPSRLAAVENVYTDTNVTIASSDWTASNGSYVYTWTSALVTANCGIEVFLRDGAENAGISGFNYDKVTGGVQFTTDEQPTGSLPVTIRIINTASDQIVSLSADEIATEAISGCDDVEEALTNLDGRITSTNTNIGNLSSLTTTAQNNVVAAINELDGDIGTLNSNLGSPSSASAVTGADAFSKINTLNSKLKTYSAFTVTAGPKFTINSSRVQVTGAFVYVSLTAFASSGYGNTDVIAVVPASVVPMQETIVSDIMLIRDGQIIGDFCGYGTIATNGNITQSYTPAAGANGDMLIIRAFYPKV